MKFNKGDFGSEIISILTRGMYLDPKDTLREYIQNGIDAKATKIIVKIRQSNIIIEDNGCGMNIIVLRKAAKLGVSEKIPSKDVGFMGIGIYSSFHLCNKLVIYSRTKNDKPNRLIVDFLSMRNMLEKQRKARFEGNLDESQIIDLQTLFEKNIEINVIEEKDFEKIGTRVELIGVASEFFENISKFSDVEKYLQQTIPLHFDPDFIWGKEIEKNISNLFY